MDLEQLRLKLGELKEKRDFCEAEYERTFGNREFGDQLRMMQMIRKNQRENRGIDQLYRKLGEEMLVVPSDLDSVTGEIAMDQMSTALLTYDLDRGIWDPVIDIYEENQ